MHVFPERLIVVAKHDTLLFTNEEFLHLKECSECFQLWFSLIQEERQERKLSRQDVRSDNQAGCVLSEDFVFAAKNLSRLKMASIHLSNVDKKTDRFRKFRRRSNINSLYLKVDLIEPYLVTRSDFRGRLWNELYHRG